MCDDITLSSLLFIHHSRKRSKRYNNTNKERRRINNIPNNQKRLAFQHWTQDHKKATNHLMTTLLQKRKIKVTRWLQSSDLSRRSLKIGRRKRELIEVDIAL
jgi:GT2 family glycosyltransferase